MPNCDAQANRESGESDELGAPTPVEPGADDARDNHFDGHGRYLADPLKGNNQGRAFILLGHRGGTVSVGLAYSGDDLGANWHETFQPRSCPRDQVHTLEAATI